MVQFACKKIDLLDVVKCSLNLTKAELKILEFFLKNHGDYTSQEVSAKIYLDLSTIQRGVKKLFEQEILSRRQMNASNGGYYYTYSIKNKKDISKVIMSIIHSWVDKVDDSLQLWLK